MIRNSWMSFISFILIFSSELSLSSPLPPVEMTQKLINNLLNESFEERIGLNKSGQFGFLSKRLITLIKIAECDCTRAYKEENQPLPWVDAGIFFDTWDLPSTCIVYPAKPIDRTLSLPVSCVWGENKDRPKGETIKVFFKLVFEGQDWKIDNVIHQKSRFVDTKTDLIQRLIDAGNQSSSPSTCKKSINRAS